MNISEYITPVSGLQYFVVMQDYGRDYPGKRGPSGFEAVTHPEDSRRAVIEDVRDMIANGRTLVHIKHICGNDMQDVTEELLREALQDSEHRLITVSDLIEARNDHRRDLRKHSETV